jgi:hypothetical protein
MFPNPVHCFERDQQEIHLRQAVPGAAKGRKMLIPLLCGSAKSGKRLQKNRALGILRKGQQERQMVELRAVVLMFTWKGQLVF